MNIKHTTILFIIICLLLSSPVFASQKAGGFFVRATSANMFGSTIERFDEQTDQLTSFGAGLFYNLRIHHEFLLQIELGVETQGVKRSFNREVFNGSIHFEETSNFKYITIPMLARFPFPKFKGSNPSIYIGPQFSLKWSAKTVGNYVVSGDSPFVNASYDGDISNAKFLTVGLVLGTDIEISVNEAIYVFDFRYSISPARALKDIDLPFVQNGSGLPLADLNTGQGYDLKHSVLSFALGLKIF